jgi:hypothetical protein
MKDSVIGQKGLDVIIGHFSHLRKYYSSDKEMRDHFMSGEVTISVRDMVRIVSKHHKDFDGL